MIPDWPTTLAAFCAAAAFFTAIGLPFARLAMPAGIPPLAMAPMLGWAVFTVIALPVLSLTGIGGIAISVLALFALASAAACWRTAPAPLARLPRWTLGLAAAAAWLPAMAIMPKHVADGILLAPPLFDHVKIALVDAILRTGLPVPNPFYGPQNPGHLAYYYLWHFGTAVLAGALHIGGWAAEAAMTGFTAFASLMLMMGLASAFGGGRAALLLAPLLCLPGTMRPLLDRLVGAATAKALIPGNADLAGWLNQAAWVPQHLSSAGCVILSALLIRRLAESGSLLAAALLGLTAAAGFESSIWVGGIAFAACAPALGLLVLWRADSATRRLFLLRALGAAVLTACLIAPFVNAELNAVRMRHIAGGLALAPYPVFGIAIPAGWRDALDLPAFWFLTLPFAFPAIAPLAAAHFVTRLRVPCALAVHRFGTRTQQSEAHPVGWASAHHAQPAATPHTRQHPLFAPLALTALLCLIVASLLRSTIDNNDLGWRAILPAILILTPAAACACNRLVTSASWAKPAAILALAALGTPDTFRMLTEYANGQRPGDAAGMARAEPFWQAMDRWSGPQDRIGSNPLAVAQATPWPVNIAWATFANRPSCYAGWASVIAYGTLPLPDLIETNARFTRVFAGNPHPADIALLARHDNCAVIALSPSDAAWTHDPFAGSPDYRLVDAASAWRIYVRVGPR